MSEPKVRFRQDDGSSYSAWSLVPLSELTYLSGVRNKANADLESYSISNTLGFIPQNEQFEDAGYLNNADRSLYIIVEPGSFAYNPARINIGSIGYQNVGKKVLVSSLYEVFSTTDVIDDSFLMQWFRTEAFQKNVRTLSEGGVRQYFYYDKLCMVQFSLPCLEEQQKIADFLISVDEVIAASEEEVANLETQKKSVMEKIFSQKVRFKKSDGSDFPEWEEILLSDICEMITVGIANSATHAYRVDGIVMLRNQNIKENALDDSDLIYIDEAFEKKYKNKRLKENDILVARTGNPGIACLVPKKYINAQTFTTLIVRLIQSDLHPAYICQYINSPRGKEYVASTQIGGGQKNSGAGIISKMPVILPCLEEQRLIADFLSNFDEAIAAAKKELELWKELKKGLLQQMFV